jgi:hypothetical protein
VSLEAAALQVTFGAAPTAAIGSDDVFLATIAVGDGARSRSARPSADDRHAHGRITVIQIAP